MASARNMEKPNQRVVPNSIQDLLKYSGDTNCFTLLQIDVLAFSPKVFCPGIVFSGKRSFLNHNPDDQIFPAGSNLPVVFSLLWL